MRRRDRLLWTERGGSKGLPACWPTLSEGQVGGPSANSDNGGRRAEGAGVALACRSMCDLHGGARLRPGNRSPGPGTHRAPAQRQGQGQGQGGSRPMGAETRQGPWRSPLADVQGHRGRLRQGPRPCALSTAVSSVHPGFCLEKSRPSLRPLRPDCVHHGCLQGLPGLHALNLNSALAPSLHSPGDSPGQRSHMKPRPFKSAPNRTKMATERLTPCLA